MLYEQAEVDSYIAEHMYGGAGDAHSTLYSENTPGSKGLKYFDLDKMAGVVNPVSSKSVSGFHEDPARLNDLLLSPFEVYIALVKGYCVILILIIPRAFVTGGLLMSAILMICSGITSTLCANLLVQSGLR